MQILLYFFNTFISYNTYFNIIIINLFLKFSFFLNIYIINLITILYYNIINMLCEPALNYFINILFKLIFSYYISLKRADYKLKLIYKIMINVF